MNPLPPMHFLLRRALVSATLLLGLAACSLPPAQPDPTRYYVLTPLGRQAEGTATAGARWRVALRPVAMPNFLRGKTMAVRVGSNEVVYVDEARWAETLEAGIGRVLRESLESRPEIAFVATSSGEDHDLDVAVRVLRCEGDREKGVARFTAAVEIYAAGPGGARRGRDIFTTEVPGWDRQNYGQLASKLSEAVDVFGDRIVALLATVQKQ